MLYPTLSFQIVGAAFEVFNALGPGLQERTYQRAFVTELGRRGIPYREQVQAPVEYQGVRVGTYYLDAIVDGSVIVELKCTDYFSPKHIRQVVNYLKITDMQLAILLHFTRDGVRQKRILRDRPTDSDIRTDSPFGTYGT